MLFELHELNFVYAHFDFCKANKNQKVIDAEVHFVGQESLPPSVVCIPYLNTSTQLVTTRKLQPWSQTKPSWISNLWPPKSSVTLKILSKTPPPPRLQFLHLQNGVGDLHVMKNRKEPRWLVPVVWHIASARQRIFIAAFFS